MLRKLTAVAMMTIVAMGAFAQEYPNRPVKIIVGYVPGGTPDVVARRLGQKLTQMTGQTFVVENKPGSGTAIASSLVAKAPADGYTLLVTDMPTHVMAAYQIKNLPYHPLKDFTPVTRLTSGSMVLVSSAKTSIRTVSDLVREAKANPGKINYGSTGIGGQHHLVAEFFAHNAGIKLTHIPYKGSGQALPALLTGEVSVLFTGLGAVMPHIKAGNVNLLAVADATVLRSADLAGVPWLSDTMKDFVFTGGIGLFAPAGLPKDVLTKLLGLVKQAMQSPEVTEQLRAGGMTEMVGTPDEFAAELVRTQNIYAQATKLANIQPE